MYAIVASGGKQYKVSTGDRIRVDRIDGEAGKEVQLNDVLFFSDGKEVKVGTPTVEKAKILAEIVKHGRGVKVMAFKYEKRKHYHRKVGHRRDYTELEIKQIEAGGM